jgi:hypothetical protein
MNKFYSSITAIFFPKQKREGLIYVSKISSVAKKMIQIVRPFTMLSYSRLLSLYALVKYCEENHIDGDYMECGVWKGGAVALMALTNLKYGKKRRHLHLFDIFDDVCPPDIHIDGNKAIQDVFQYTTIKTVKELQKIPPKQPLKGFYNKLGGKGSLKDCQNLLISKIKYNPSYIHYYRGWFEDTMPSASKKIKQLAVLHIDADWYRSVKISLEYFYPKVIKGGYIIIDDYGYYEGCTKAVNDYFSTNHIHLKPNIIDSGCVYFTK